MVHHTLSLCITHRVSSHNTLHITEHTMSSVTSAGRECGEYGEECGEEEGDECEEERGEGDGECEEREGGCGEEEGGCGEVGRESPPPSTLA